MNMPAKKKPNKKKSAKIKWGNVALVCVLAVVVGLGTFFLFSSNDGDGDEISDPPLLPIERDYISIDFHFPLIGLDGWDSESRQIEIADESVMIHAVITGIAEGPRRTTQLAPSFVAGLTIEWIEFAEAAGRVDISFSQNFNELSASSRINLLGSIVYTLTELEFVNNLRFFVGTDRESPIFGEADALRNRGNTLLTAAVPPPIPRNITLYFPEEQMLQLVAEQRAISVDTLVGGEYVFAVEALVQGPTTAGLSPALPANATFNGVHSTGNIVFVDFTSDFINAFSGGSTEEYMMIHSLVNTLTGLSGISLVQFFVDGQPIVGDSRFHMEDLSTPFERREDMIRDN